MADFKLRGQVELSFSPKKGVSEIAAQIRRELGGSIPVNLAVKGDSSSAIDRVRSRAKELIKETENIGKGMSSSIQRNSSKSIEEYKKFITNVEKETKKLNKTVNLFDSFVGGVSTRFAQFGKFAIASAGIQKIVQAIDYGFDAIIKINSAQIKLQQITGNTAAEVNRFSSSIIQLSRNVGVASTDLLEASDTLAQAGFGLKTIQGLMKSLANTQLVPTFDNLEKTTEGVVSAIAQFQLLDVNGSTRNVDKFLSTLNTLSKKYAVEAGNIIEAIKSAGGVFAASEGILGGDSLGLGTSANADKNLDKLREFASIVTSIRSTTRLSESVISTGLRTIINRLQDPSVEAKLKEILGADFSLRNTRGEFIGTLKAAENLNLALQDVGSNTRTFIEVANAVGGGVRQAKIAIPLITSVADSYKALAQARKGDNSLSKDAEIAAESLSVKITKIGQDLAAFGVKVAESSGFKIMLDQIREVIKGVTFLLDTLSPALQVGVAMGLGNIIGPALYNMGRGTISTLSGAGPGSLISRRDLGYVSATPALDKIKVRNPYYSSGTTDEVYGALANNRKRFAKGGYVNALLMPGEVVFSPEEVQRIGLNNLEKINRQGLAGVDSVPATLPHGSYVLNKNSVKKMGIGGGFNSIEEFRTKPHYVKYNDVLGFFSSIGIPVGTGGIDTSSSVDDIGIINLKSFQNKKYVNSNTAVHESMHHFGLDYEALKTPNYIANYGDYLAQYIHGDKYKELGFDPKTPAGAKTLAMQAVISNDYADLPLEGATVFAEKNIKYSDIKKLLPRMQLNEDMIKDILRAQDKASQSVNFNNLIKYRQELKKNIQKYIKDPSLENFKEVSFKSYLEERNKGIKTYNESLTHPVLVKRRNTVMDFLRSKLPGFANGGIFDHIQQEVLAGKVPYGKNEKIATGWKLHIASDESNREGVGQYLQNSGLLYKSGKSSGQDNKDFTVYVGHRDQAQSVADKISKDIGELLKSDKPEENLSFNNKISGRFDATNVKGDYDLFGRYPMTPNSGVPLLMSDMNKLFGSKDKTGILKQATPAAITALSKIYGSFFSGSPKTNIPAPPPPPTKISRPRLISAPPPPPTKISRPRLISAPPPPPTKISRPRLISAPPPPPMKLARFASGGFVGTVPGLGNQDNFPTYLEDGSFVLNKKAASLLRRGKIQRFAKGGIKSPFNGRLTDDEYVNNIEDPIAGALGIPQIAYQFTDNKYKNTSAVATGGGIVYNYNPKTGIPFGMQSHEIAHNLGVDVAMAQSYGGVFETERRISNNATGLKQGPYEGIAQFLGKNKEFSDYLNTLGQTETLTKKQQKALNLYYDQIMNNVSVLADQGQNIETQINQEKQGANNPAKIARLEKELLSTQKKYSDTIKGAQKRIRDLAISMNPEIGKNLEKATNKAREIILKEVVVRAKKQVESERLNNELKFNNQLSNQIGSASKGLNVLSKEQTPLRNLDKLSNLKPDQLNVFSQALNNQKAAQQAFNEKDVETGFTKKGQAYTEIQTRIANLQNARNSAPAEAQKSIDKQLRKLEKKQEQAKREYYKSVINMGDSATNLTTAKEEVRRVGGVLQVRDKVASGFYASGISKVNTLAQNIQASEYSGYKNSTPYSGSATRLTAGEMVRGTKAVREDFFTARNVAGQNLIERFNAKTGSATPTLTGIKDLNRFLQTLSKNAVDLSKAFPSLHKEVQAYIKIQNRAVAAQTTYTQALEFSKTLTPSEVGAFGTSGQTTFLSADVAEKAKEAKNAPKFVRPDGLTPVQAANQKIKQFIFGERVDPEIARNARNASQSLPGLSGREREAALSDISLFEQRQAGLDQKRFIRNQRVGTAGLAAGIVGSVLASSENKTVAAGGNILANTGAGASIGVSFGGLPGAVAGGIAGGGLSLLSQISKNNKETKDAEKLLLASNIEETINKGARYRNDPGTYRNLNKQISDFAQSGNTRFADQYGLYRGGPEVERSRRKTAYKNAGIAMSMVTGGLSNFFFDSEKRAEEDSYKAQAKRDKANRNRVGEYLNKTDEVLPKILEQTAPDRAKLSELSEKQRRGSTQARYMLTSAETEQLKTLRQKLKPVQDLEFNSEFFSEIGEQGVSDFEAFTRDPNIKKKSVDQQIQEFTRRQQIQKKDGGFVQVQNRYADAADKVRKRQQDREKLITKSFDIEDAYRRMEGENVDIVSRRQDILPKIQAIRDTADYNTKSYLQSAEARRTGDLTSAGRATNIGMILNNRLGYDRATRNQAQSQLEGVFGKDSRVSRISRETSMVENFGANFATDFSKQINASGFTGDSANVASSMLNDFLKKSNLEGTDTGKNLRQKFDKVILSEAQGNLNSEEVIKSKLRTGDFQGLIDETVSEGKNIVSQGAAASDELTNQRVGLLNQYSDAKLTARKNKFNPIRQAAEFKDQFDLLSGASNADIARNQVDLKNQEIRNLVGINRSTGQDFSVQELKDRKSALETRRGELDINNKNAQQEMANLTTEIKAVDEAMNVLANNTAEASAALAEFEEKAKKRNVDRQNALGFVLGSDQEREGAVKRQKALEALQSGNINYNNLTEEERSSLSGAIENERQRDPKKAAELEKQVLLGAASDRGDLALQQFQSGGNLGAMTEQDRGEIKKRLEAELTQAEKDGDTKGARKAKKALGRFDRATEKLGVDTGGYTDFAKNKIKELAQTPAEFAENAPEKAQLEKALQTNAEAAGYFNDQDKQVITDISNAFNSLNESVKQLGNIDFGSINFDPALQAAQTFEKAANLLASAQVNIQGNVTVTGAVSGGGGGANDAVLTSVQSVVDKALSDFATANNMNYSKLT
jgi:hypothetical protein